MPLTQQQIKDIESNNRKAMDLLQHIQEVASQTLVACRQGAIYLAAMSVQGDPMVEVTNPDGVKVPAILGISERADTVAVGANALGLIAPELPGLIEAANVSAALIREAAGVGE